MYVSKNLNLEKDSNTAITCLLIGYVLVVSGTGAAVGGPVGFIIGLGLVFLSIGGLGVWYVKQNQETCGCPTDSTTNAKPVTSTRPEPTSN